MYIMRVCVCVCVCVYVHVCFIVAEDFPVKFGHSDQYSMSDVLWTCSNMLSDR